MMKRLSSPVPLFKPRSAVSNPPSQVKLTASDVFNVGAIRHDALLYAQEFSGTMGQLLFWHMGQHGFGSLGNPLQHDGSHFHSRLSGLSRRLPSGRVK